jgi:hypothetical protein
MSDDIVSNLKQPSQWLRILFMLGFAVVLYVVGLVVIVLTLAQMLFSLLTGKDNLNLRSLGSSLSRYILEILIFLTYNGQIKPFPFTPFPVMEPDAPASAPVEPAEPAAEEAAVDLSAGSHNPHTAAAEADLTESDTTQPAPVEVITVESDAITPDTSSAATDTKSDH